MKCFHKILQKTFVNRQRSSESFVSKIRESGLFDERYYRDRYSDIDASMDAVAHFAAIGWIEKRNPHPLFDTAYYLHQNPDVYEAGVNPLIHFIDYGYRENRNPNWFFNMITYRHVHAELLQPDTNPVVHFATVHDTQCQCGARFDDWTSCDRPLFHFNEVLPAITGDAVKPEVMLPVASLETKSIETYIGLNEFRKSLDEVLAEVAIKPLKEMIIDLVESDSLYHPSKFWLHFMRLHNTQLARNGFENFKRTLNRYYFNWGPLHATDQLITLRQLLPPSYIRKDWDVETVTPLPDNCSEYEAFKFKEFLHLIWLLAKNKDRLDLLSKTEESLTGNPIAIKKGDRIISEDLCNSVIELNAALESFNGAVPAELGVIELGAGYGRIAHLLLSSFTGAKITIVDIPPALYVAQEYLQKVLPHLKCFTYRKFTCWEKVKHEFEVAQIRFLLAPQVELLPDKLFNVFLNISSLHEMLPSQIDYWFGQIDRLCYGYFYSKQLIVHNNEYDNMSITREDYPVRKNWTQIYNRVCPVQKLFFEALYKIK